jgi:hypothetical protein
MKKITVKYLENGYSYKSSRSKNSNVVTKSTKPVLNDLVVEDNATHVRLKTNKYSVIYNKLNGKTEISQFFEMLIKQSIKKSRLVKETTLTVDDIDLLKADFSLLENYYI